MKVFNIESKQIDTGMRAYEFVSLNVKSVTVIQKDLVKRNGLVQSKMLFLHSSESKGTTAPLHLLNQNPGELQNNCDNKILNIRDNRV